MPELIWLTVAALVVLLAVSLFALAPPRRPRALPSFAEDDPMPASEIEDRDDAA